jgi:Rps23 Pro-64 3,4-dihydroxylase Tpa1-like proline 4-hydroxylase
MIDIDALVNAKMFKTPFQWGVADGVFPINETTIRMADEFPVDSYRYRSYLGGRYFRRQFIRLGAQELVNPSELSDAYHQLGAALLSANYREALSKTTGVDLEDAPMEAAFWRSDNGTIFARHDDAETKLLTHVLYLNHSWRQQDGGNLQILGSKNEDDVVYELVPRLGTSALIVRSDDSWHNISPIKPTAANSRNTITVHFHKPGTTENDLPTR